MTPMAQSRGLCVRRATAADWETWRDLRLRALQDSPTAFGSTYERERAFTEEDWRDRLSGGGDGAPLTPGSSGPAVLAFLEGAPVGMGGGYVDLPGWLHVVAMWTAPDRRSLGAGRAVLEWIVAWAGARGLRVHLDVETGNAGARQLYERCGFVGTGEISPLREGSSYRLERMVLPVTPDSSEVRLRK